MAEDSFDVIAKIAAVVAGAGDLPASAMVTGSNTFDADTTVIM